jgi:hypothetical protein
MAVEFINGKYYNVPDNGSFLQRASYLNAINRDFNATSAGLPSPFDAPTPIGAPPMQQAQQVQANTGMYSDPFGTAMSGTQKGTLQPYVNRMTQNASNALYGGLLGYQPQSMVAGNAGGTPVNSTVPKWRLPSAIPTPNQGQVGLLGSQANQQPQGIFGNRAWMEY